MAALCTVAAATQPALMRFGATRANPMLFAAGCAVVATLCVLPVVYARGELPMLVDRRYRMRLLTLSIIGTVVTTLTLIFGLRRIDAVAGTLLLQSEPVYSLLLATLFAGERPTARQLVATAIIVVGIASAVGASSSSYSPAWAAILVAATPLLWQTSHVLSLPVMPPLSPLCMTAARYGYASIVLALALAAVDPYAVVQLREPVVLVTIVATGVICYFLASLAWYAAITRLSLAWTTALVIPGIPLLSILCAIVFLGERATLRDVVGILVSICGVLLLVLGAEGARRTPARAAEATEAAEAFHQPMN
ncbi:MAG TPA: DMT family transporter [Candidatus Binataceae bacterium]|jgi:drug/metabolite transporter (DMT)-like permease|nr:DMT family transporter [Candidatus Binataceae bacterium]